MESTLKKYRDDIQSGKINPVVRWNGKSGQIFAPSDSQVPLDYIGFGAWNLKEGPFSIETKDLEYVLVPICGNFEVKVEGKVFEGAREGGPFQTEPETSNSSAVYIGRDKKFSITGDGEMIYYSAPATAENPAVFVKAGDKPQLRRGTITWHRDVITLITPDDVSTNLVVGETYSPPSLWSGTPLHVHDKDDLANGQSDHEEVYYHLSRVSDGKWGAYGVQLLFDDKGLDRAYMVHNNDAVAIPGGAHPVVSGPVSDMLYVWALASNKASKLGMLDVEEFAYIKAAQTIIDALEEKRGKYKFPKEELAKLADENNLKGHEREILRQHLLERGFEIG